MLDVVKFNLEFKIEKEEFGYYVVKIMILKMIDECMIKCFFGFIFFIKKIGFKVLELFKIEEMFVKY